MAFGLEKLASLFSFDLADTRSVPIVGVDMGSSSIKIVQLHLENGTPMLDTYGELQLGPYGDQDVGKMPLLPEKRLIEALVDIIRESAATASEAALSISYVSSFATTLSLDTIDEADIATRVPVEARKYIPTSLNEVTLDWFPLSVIKSPPRTDIFLVAIHNEALDASRRALSGSGLNLSYAELEPFSAARSVLSLDRATAAIVDFGASGTRIYIAREGMIHATHKIAMGGAALTSAISKELGISFAEAEEKKRVLGVTESKDNTPLARTIRTELERAVREIHQIIEAYERSAGAKIPLVMIVGGGAGLPGLQEFMRGLLQRTVTIADPFNKVAYPAFLVDTIKSIGSSFATAIGSALRQFEPK